MALSAKEAADRVGMSKGGIIKAIRSGKISAQKNSNGEWSIEPVELFRVYSPVNTRDIPDGVDSERQDTPEITPSMQREVELLREMIQRQDDVISNLWERLEVEADERRKLTMMLTEVQHQRAPEVPPEATTPPPERKRSWWSRLLGGV